MRKKDKTHEKVKTTVLCDAMYFGRDVITNVLDEYASFVFRTFYAENRLLQHGVTFHKTVRLIVTFLRTLNCKEANPALIENI
jgi:hypothetical protein